MSSPQDEFEDSRTSRVGRKRDLEDLNPQQDARSVTSDEEDNERSSKRVKQVHEPLGDSAAHDEETLDASSSFDPPPSQSQNSSPPNIAQSSVWNKIVQSGLRTSFGSKVNIKPQAHIQQAFVLRDDSPEILEPFNKTEVVNADDDTRDVNMDVEHDSQDIPQSITKQDVDYDDGNEIRAILQENRPVFGDDFQDTAYNDSDSEVDYEPGRSSQPQSPAKGSVGNIEDLSRSFPGMTSDVGYSKMALLDTPATTHTEPASQQNISLDESLALFKEEVDRSEPVYPKDFAKIPQAKQPKREYKIPGTTFQLSQMFRGGGPLSLQELTFQDFKSHFLTSNSKTKNLKPRNLKGAFSSYITYYYPNAPAEVRARTLSTAPLFKDKEIKQKTESKIENPPKQKVNEKPKTSKQKGNGKIEDPKIEKVQKGIQEATSIVAESQMTAPINAPTPVIPSLPDVAQQAVQMSPSSVDTRDDMGDYEDVAMEEDESHDLQDTASADGEPADAMNVEITEMELALQQKYFPAVAGSSIGPRCLACADSGHTTIKCPALSCTICGVSGNHTTFTCPQNQRCGKCRQKGHAMVECPEKLFANNVEVGNCELCGSPDHLEMACHRVWRNFAPRPEEIKRVRDIPIHCYSCGGSGHYGPECGIHTTKILSGGVTWSQANLQMYLDPNSAERAISAGKDYSIPQRKVFAIKGKANDPIVLEDSDEDVSFIRPKINYNPTQRRNGSIRFEQSSRLTQETSDNSYNRTRNPPRQAAPVFGSNTRFQDDSARYGREQTFSPPPNYDRFVPENDRYQPQLPYRHNSYRPLPANPRPPQEYPAQPAQKQSGGGNGGGNRGRRPNRGGGQAPARARAASPPKKAKKKPKKAKAARGGKATG